MGAAGTAPARGGAVVRAPGSGDPGPGHREPDAGGRQGEPRAGGAGRRVDAVVLHAAPALVGAPAAAGVLRRRPARDHGRHGAAQPPIYGIYAWTGYIFVYRLQSRLAAADRRVRGGRHRGHVAGGRCAGHGSAWVLRAVLLLFNVAIAVGFTWIGSIGNEQNERRKQLVDELSEANRKLEATLAENAGPARAAAGPGPGGRDLRRAAADGQGDPRHPGPGPDRDRHPAAGGRAGRGEPAAAAAPASPRYSWPATA